MGLDIQQLDIQQKEQIEIQFWQDSPLENPESEAVENLVNKFCEARILLEKLSYHRAFFEQASSILELGAGQGWASCLVKQKFEGTSLTATDISPYAIASLPKWEHVFKTQLDHAISCRSYDIPLSDETVDLIFCFEAAHHFVKHRRSLAEIYRVLKKGGVCLYLHEPVCRSFIYPLAYARVNKIRPEVPEDVLIYPKIKQLATEAGFETKIRFDPTVTNRGLNQTFYYAVLSAVPGLRYVLPCSADFIFIK
ncbi:class I SAM-dependent methyltransferase [Myxacorys almedinensis]|uniref:Methyltransferase domain-containing protein n=1 Tax=Myxacorys almedinensis A TaxID=2690445 RepID=A0A8J7YXS7_9CYAN|nr:class I SAM-dependent methyltransferase [Myxacorys almedinensis]NDJ16632.1 methyltransferase domain-containing protein [Myxacorys almedinensis A]